MKQTFQDASATYSWLGPARDDSVWRFDLLRLGDRFSERPEDLEVSLLNRNLENMPIWRRRLPRALVKFTQMAVFYKAVDSTGVRPCCQSCTFLWQSMDEASGPDAMARLH
jgi:hypothetical protein